MSIYSLKPAFQRMLRPLVTTLYNKRITANQVTVLACVLSIILGGILCLFYENYQIFLLLPLWLFLRMALNAIDGMLAREFNQQSKLGAYLNEITDVISDAFLYIPFAFVAPIFTLQIALFIWLASLTEFCGILGQIQGNGRRYDGPFGKSDRALFFGIIGLYYGIYGELPAIFDICLLISNIALLYTCYNRVKKGLTFKEK